MLREQIDRDLIEAMKLKDGERTSVLRMLKSAMKNLEIQQKKELGDEDILSVIQSQIKTRRDSILMYQKGGRKELAQKEEKEIGILKKYLPQQVSESAIYELAKKIISETGASDIRDMGKVMAKAMSELKGKADGALVSKIVKEELSPK